MTNIQLRFLCLGTGAIGMYIGGSLAQTGQKVVFLDQPETAARIRAAGIGLVRDGQEFRLEELDVVDNLNDALTHGPYDAALLAVKSYDTDAILSAIAPYQMALPPLICLQNGVENEDKIAAVLGEDKVIPATVTTAIGRAPSGAIIVEKLRGVGIADNHMLGPALLAVFNQAHLRAKIYTRPRAMKWSKLLTNILANATAAILDMPPADIYKNPQLWKVEAAMFQEAVRVMHASHIPVQNLPGTRVRALTNLLTRLPLWLSRPVLYPFLAGGRGAKMPSFHIDLHSGRGKNEVEYLNGAIVRQAERVGLKAPVNNFLTQTLTALTNGSLPLRHYAADIELFLRDLRQHQAANP